MMKIVQFYAEARIEADVAELQSQDRFLFALELAGALESIASGRVIAPMVERGPARIWILPRLPYSIIYDDRGTEIRIVAFAHHARKPGYWRKRLKS